VISRCVVSMLIVSMRMGNQRQRAEAVILVVPKVELSKWVSAHIHSEITLPRTQCRKAFVSRGATNLIAARILTGPAGWSNGPVH